ncbi:MAG: Crp/Fnr family transcriptional regulator [Caulobacteraceae bacterium]
MKRKALQALAASRTFGALERSAPGSPSPPPATPFRSNMAPSCSREATRETLCSWCWKANWKCGPWAGTAANCASPPCPAGSLIGEMAALDGASRSADVVAARRCQLWRISRTALLGALKAHPDAALALLAELSGRLRAANAALELVSRRDLEAQLAFLLLAERNRTGLVVLTQTEMARRIGFSREKVNRRLHAWAAVGLGGHRSPRRAGEGCRTAPESGPLARGQFRRRASGAFRRAGPRRAGPWPGSPPGLMAVL